MRPTTQKNNARPRKTIAIVAVIAVVAIALVPSPLRLTESKFHF